MSITCTKPVELDADFEAFATITKSVEKNGRRYIVGVASGVEVDRDGERVSADCIRSLAAQIKTGNVVLTSSHQQDWATTIGKATEAEHDTATGELIVTTELPVAGIDPLADKAWHTVNNSPNGVGFSIGGKLTKAFYERNEVGKRRKVLDGIHLRHLMLTEKPSYAGSYAEGVAKSLDFAEEVAKSFEGVEPADEEFTEVEIVKDFGGASSNAGGNSGQDSTMGDRRPAEGKKGAQMRTDTDGEDDQDDNPTNVDLPKAERHLACPNCGTEFAADLPAPDNTREPDEPTASLDGEDKPTAKTVEETDMSLSDSLATLRELTTDVAKTGETATDGETAAVAAETVEKAATVGDDIAKTVAKAVIETNERLDAFEANMATALELIAKSHQGILAEVKSLPQGRKSIARVLPPGAGHDDGATVEKTTDELIAETDNPLAALKVLNAANPAYAGR